MSADYAKLVAAGEVRIVRMMCRGGSFIDVALATNDAEELVEQWREDKLAGSKIGGVSLTGQSWAVDVLEIQFVFVIDPRTIPEPQPQQQVAQQQKPRGYQSPFKK